LTHIKVSEEKDKTEKKSAAAETREKEKEDKKPDLEAKLQEKEKEAKENYDRFLRLSAEMENFKKRVEKEKVESYKFANENLLKDLLPILDNLERALEHGHEAENTKAFLEGVDMVLKGFLAILEKHGVTRIEASGEEFDPNQHEAVMVQEDNSRPPGVVISQLQKGYRLHDRLVRPAMVVVSKKPEINPDQDPEA
jgi:molecular chaperone GrpE